MHIYHPILCHLQMRMLASIWIANTLATQWASEYLQLKCYSKCRTIYRKNTHTQIHDWKTMSLTQTQTLAKMKCACRLTRTIQNSIYIVLWREYICVGRRVGCTVLICSYDWNWFMCVRKWETWCSGVAERARGVLSLYISERVFGESLTGPAAALQLLLWLNMI